MPEEHETTALERLKLEARRYRAEALLTGAALSHSASLEHVAKHHGFRDWNTASAVLKKHEPALTLNQRVSGRYLGCRFEGEVIALRTAAGGRTELEIALSSPIDVVRFRSFSSIRRRVRGVVCENGASKERVSSGDPYLEIDQMRPRTRSARHGK